MASNPAGSTVPSGNAKSPQYLWQKGGNANIDIRLMAMMSEEDVHLDQQIFLYDIEASKAHVQGLERIKLIGSEESKAICDELDNLAVDFRAGKFRLDSGQFEDGHSAIECRLIERLGDVGKKVHTGRSRNDQVLVATRLYLKDQLRGLIENCVKIAEICLARAEEKVPMPGYTHLQRAVVSSTGMWFAGWAEAFIEDGNRARQTLGWIDANPLGTAAGYGVNVPLDRDFTTSQLGFSRLQISPIAAQLSRGKFEMAALEAFGSALLDIRRLAWDLSLFATAEFDFVQLHPEYTTGSSIMPNKRNPDVIELLRGGYARISGARNEMEQILSLPSGYQRDIQLIKSPLLRGCRHGLEMLSIVPDLLLHLGWNEAKMRAAIEPSMYATDLALEFALQGMPFRQAYQETAKLLASSEPNNLLSQRRPEESLAARVSPGAAGNPLLDRLKAQLDELKRK